jgi:hypothetical protein
MHSSFLLSVDLWCGYMARDHVRLGVIIIVCQLGLACGGAEKLPPVEAPSYDPEACAAAAISEYDSNKNGTIEGPELDRVPGLKQALIPLDTNKDRKLSKDELKVRFEHYQSARAGAVGVNIVVKQKGQPVKDATVTLTPEAFMKDSIPIATGKTDETGTVSNYTANGQTLPGVAPGVYRVTISNAPDKLFGCEVSGGGRGGANLVEFNIP